MFSSSSSSSSFSCSCSSSSSSSGNNDINTTSNYSSINNDAQCGKCSQQRNLCMHGR